MAVVTFIGLGNMGLPMALNLLKSGHSVTGFDLAKDQVKILVDAGGQSTENINIGRFTDPKRINISTTFSLSLIHI